MRSPIKSLYPKKEIFDRFSYKEQKKLGNLIIGNVICISLFVLTTIFMFITGNRIASGLTLISDIAFIVSAVIAKKGAIYKASWLATVGYAIACGVVAFFMSTDISMHIGYRVFGFCLVMVILNFMIALKPSQILVFYGIIQVYQVVATFTSNKEAFQMGASSVIEVLIICALGSVMTSLALFYVAKLNDEIVRHSEKEHDEAENALAKITNVLSKTKESLNIGQKLNAASDSANIGAEKINELYALLIKEADALTVLTSEAKNASEEINIQAGKINSSIKTQNESLSNTSAAMTEISANLSNINTIADKRRKGLENIADILKLQSGMITSLVAEVEKLKESSKKIAEFVKTVDAIAGQTSLLAMNASIEAAHAGNMGKGFSVIALEIRKLSEQTTKNAALIAETLKENTEVVQNTIDQVQGFAKSNEGSSNEIYSSVNAIEEILRGISEMDAGTRDVMHSLQEVVDLANDNGAMITSVVNQISSQDESFSGITNTTEIVRNRVEEINAALASINSTVQIIQVSAKQNEEVSEKIAHLLD